MTVNLPSLRMTTTVKRILIGAGVVLLLAAVVILVVSWLHRSANHEA